MSGIDWDLLFRYLGNECDVAERERVAAWLEADPAHRALLDAAVLAAARVLDREIAPSAARRVVVRRPAPARKRTWWTFAAAASLVIAAGGALAWRAVGPTGSGAHVSASDFRVVTTSRGERAAVHLEDGTRVVLGPATTLRHPADFGRRSRDVHLTGEAYFVVEADESRPFRVHAGGGIAEDLGTAFSIRFYPEDSAVQVIVVEGAVALGPGSAAPGGAAVLRRGQMGRLAMGQSVPITEFVDIEASLGWRDGRLVFEEDPLPEVLAHLGRWFDASFVLGDTSLASSRLTASFTSDSLGEVLGLLAPALDVRFEHRGDTVLVLPRLRPR